MKAPTLVKILISVFLLLVLPTSCKKERHTVLKKTDNTAEIKRLTIIADNNFDQSEYEEAFKNYNKIIALSDTIKNRVDYVDALISLGYLHQYQGDYIQSEVAVSKILPHLKYLKKTRFAWNAYFLQGFNYFKTNDPENALLYFNKALHLNTTPFRKWNILNNIGIVYMKQKQYKKATYIFEKITTEGYYGKKFRTNSLKRYELMDYSVMVNNLAICYFNLGNPQALDVYNKALNIRLKINDRENISSSYTALSEYYLKKNPTLAIKYAKMGYEKAAEINLYADQRYCLGFLIQTTNGNELKKYANLYINFIDSTNTVRLKQKNQFSTIKYNFKKDIEENLELKAQKAQNELQLQRQKNRSYISYVVISFSGFVLIFIAFYITYKGKKEKNDAIFKSEMRISDKLHNELTKDIHQILQFAKNHKLEEQETKELFLSNLNNIYSKTRSISKENSVILTDEKYEIGLKEMISEYSNSDLNIIINGLNTFLWPKIDRIKKITIFRTLQEILDTTKISQEISLASISFRKDEKNILITYVDNRLKINNEDTILKKRLQNVENRIKTIKGTINFESNLENGLKISFTFPL